MLNISNGSHSLVVVRRLSCLYPPWSLLTQCERCILMRHATCRTLGHRCTLERHICLLPKASRTLAINRHLANYDLLTDCRTCLHGVTLLRALSQRVSHISDPENTGEQTSGVNFDTLGSWNNRLKLKIDVEESIKRGTIVPELDLSTVGKCSLLGRRTTNEDRVVVKELRQNVMMFGIFDGHAGVAAVEHTAEFLPVLITHWMEKGMTDLGEVLKKAFIDVNTSFTKFFAQSLKSGDKTLSSGTTATVCLIQNGVEMTVGHVGDSRAILCRNNNAVRLTVDHLPSEHSEAARIVSCSGRLTWSSLGRSRVNGRLEMTRSIGDIELKEFGVIAEPDIKRMKIRNGSDSFLVLATDGVHSRLNVSEIVSLISACTSPQEAAEFVADQALLFGSEDNCSVVIVPFGSWGKYASAPRQVNFSRNRTPVMGTLS